ncbi:MAG TPA: 1-acyl-sn-glycerol-3-phosphate acyltransferase [Campylobacterales bacterium]|nr:1-acyl-sn-glycerol-3-phosphate acyltransferase [Campylobacterales bacterium]
MKIFAKTKFYYAVSVITLITGLFMIPLMYLFKKDSNQILHKYNLLIMKLIGGKIETKGYRDNSADIFIINHQGVVDIIAMEASELTDIRWIAKKEIFEVPWFGNVVKLSNMISVDRENKAGVIKLIRDAKETKDSNPHRVLAIFPEGTRAKGQTLRKFKSGAKILAEKLELKVQPIIITNSKKLLNQHEHIAQNTTVYINYLEPFQVNRANKKWYKELQENMQKEIYNQEKQGILR